MRSVGRRTRQRVETSTGRGGPSRRGRSDDQPVRSSEPILTLLAEEEGSGIPPRVGLAGCPVRHGWRDLVVQQRRLACDVAPVEAQDVLARLGDEAVAQLMV